MTRPYQWANPIRTGEGGSPGGRIYDCDPEAVARLKSLMAEKAKPAPKPAAAAKPNPVVNLIRQYNAKKQQKQEEPTPMQPVTIPPETVAHLWERYNDGAVLNDLAAEAGVSRHTVVKAFQINGYQYPLGERRGRKVNREISNDQLREAYQAYLRGASTEVQAEAMGIAETTLGRWWRELGYTFPVKRDRLTGQPLVDPMQMSTQVIDPFVRPIETREQRVVIPGEVSPHPLVGQIINQLLDWRDALKAHGVPLEGTLFVGGPVSVTIDL